MVDETRPLEDIEAELTELCGHLNSGTARFLSLVAEFDARNGWAEQGCRDCAEWLSWRCSISPTTAREQVRVASKLSEFPRVREAFGSGQLSYSKVRAVTRIATEATEAELLSIAKHATAADLDVMCRSYRAAVRAVDDDAADSSYVTCFQDIDGSWILHGRLRADDGAVVRKALDSGADDIERKTRASAEAPRWGERSARALVDMAEGSLNARGRRGSAADRYLVILHSDADATDLEGAEVDPATGERIACDCSVVAMLHRKAGPPDVGRRTRVISPSLRRALLARDHHCRFPGCRMRRFTDGHHLWHWIKDGPTDLNNLILLCPFHHRLVHEGGFSVARDPGGELVFCRPDGEVIERVAEQCLPRGPDLIARDRAAGISIDQHTCAPLSGEPMDHDLAVHSLLSTERSFERY